jgi:hypothetical protein
VKSAGGAFLFFIFTKDCSILFSKRYSLKISFKLGYHKNKDVPTEKELRLKTTPNNKKLFLQH